MPETIICAHRGMDDVAPENTLAAFAPALERGMAIEFDVRMTADRELVVVHDPTVDRTTDGSGPVSGLGLAEVKALDAGSWFAPEFGGERVPLLDEVLELVGRHKPVSPSVALDVSDLTAGIIEAICDCVEARELTAEVVGIGAVIGSAEVRRQFCQASSAFQCAAVAQKRGDLPSALEDGYSTWVYARFVTTVDDVHQVHRAGKRLIVCGDEVAHNVNRAHEAYNSGPDVVLSSHPTGLAELVG